MVRFSFACGLDTDNLQLPDLFNTQVIERHLRFRSNLVWLSSFAILIPFCGNLLAPSVPIQKRPRIACSPTFHHSGFYQVFRMLSFKRAVAAVFAAAAVAAEVATPDGIELLGEWIDKGWVVS